MFVALSFAAVSQLTPVPAGDASPASIAAYFAERRSGILLAAAMIGVGSAFFVWFMGALSAALRSIGPADQTLANTVLLTGSAFALLMTVGYAAGASGAYQIARQPEAGLLLRLLFDLWNGALAFGRLFFALAAALTAVAVLRTRILPRWVGWLSALLSVLSLSIGAHLVVETGPLSPTGEVAFLWFLVFAVWTVATGVALARNPALIAGDRE